MLMIALYPIKPIYVDRILSGEKKFELRRRLPKNKLEYILIYSTAPISKVVGFAKVKRVLEEDVTVLWDKYSHQFGICEGDYYSYFNGCENAKAIELEYVYKFDRKFSIKDISDETVVPQSFCYVENEAFLRLKRRKGCTV